VAAQVGSGLSLDALFARQVEPALQAREISAELDMEKFAAEFGALLTGITSAESAQETQRRVGGGDQPARSRDQASGRDRGPGAGPGIRVGAACGAAGRLTGPSSRGEQVEPDRTPRPGSAS
jgi:hypothetical protein